MAAEAEERLFTREEVSEIVRHRVSKMKGIPGEVLRDMLIALADRVDELEGRLARVERAR